MKKYVFEAPRRQLEKPTEPKYIFNTTAKVTVFAESDEEALLLAKALLEQEYHGSGVQLGDIRPVAQYALPADWNYGYGDGRKSGSRDDMDELIGQSVIR